MGIDNFSSSSSSEDEISRQTPMAATNDDQRWATPEPESATPTKTQIDFAKSPVPIGSSL